MYLGRYCGNFPVIEFQNQSLKSDFKIWHTLSKSWRAILTSDWFVSRVDCCPMFEFLCWRIPICENHCCPIWFWTFDIQVSAVECQMVTFDVWACLNADFWNCFVTCIETIWHLRLDVYSWELVAKLESWCSILQTCCMRFDLCNQISVNFEFICKFNAWNATSDFQLCDFLYQLLIKFLKTLGFGEWCLSFHYWNMFCRSLNCDCSSFKSWYLLCDILLSECGASWNETFDVRFLEIRLVEIRYWCVIVNIDLLKFRKFYFLTLESHILKLNSVVWCSVSILQIRYEVVIFWIRWLKNVFWISRREMWRLNCCSLLKFKHVNI